LKDLASNKQAAAATDLLGSSDCSSQMVFELGDAFLDRGARNFGWKEEACFMPELISFQELSGDLSQYRSRLWRQGRLLR